MRKIGFFNIGKLGLVKSAGTGKTDISKVIEEWVKEHMVFWYDMSKPVDTYIPGVTYANPFVNNGGKLTYDNTINKCTITHTPTNNNNIAFWQIIVKPLQYVESYKIRVTGLPTGFTIKGRIGYDNIQITSDGEYDIPEYRNSSTTNTSYSGFYLAGDNVNDVDCNIVVEEIPTKQSVPTNEILKTNPYLQDFSGNNRPLKLNNFLFAAMSGVGGYEYNWLDNSVFKFFIPERASGTYTDKSFHIQQVNARSNIVETKVATKSIGYKIKVSGLTSNEFVRYSIKLDGSTQNFDIKVDGEYELPLSDYEALYNMGYSIRAVSDVYPHTCNITVEQIPLYPNALVTDGVDDYGQVQNLQQGVKVLFYTCNNFRLSQILYDQRKVGYDKIQSSYFSIFAGANTIAYNARNVDGITYIDGELNESIIVDNLLKKKTIITIVNNSVDSEKTGRPSFFSTYNNLGYFANLAFYNSIGFDSVPTKQNDGFTEQDLIDYYIPKAIVTITVVDVSGSPIQDATVTVGGVQYKTLSDGTVKVRGMANGTMSLSVKKDGYMPFSDNSWKLADSRITLEVLRNTVITENGYSILLENDGLILTE